MATAVGGVPDLIGPGEGLLVPPEQPSPLARAILSVYANPTAARQRANAARNRLATQFGPEQWLARYEEVARGRIDHALRFTVQETRRAYVWPARHFASDRTTVVPIRFAAMKLETSGAISYAAIP